MRKDYGIDEMKFGSLHFLVAATEVTSAPKSEVHQKQK